MIPIKESIERTLRFTIGKGRKNIESFITEDLSVAEMNVFKAIEKAVNESSENAWFTVDQVYETRWDM